MTPHEQRCFLHFKKRVHERIGQDVDARQLWNSLASAIERNDDSVRFIVRLSSISERRLWRFYHDGGTFFVIYDHLKGWPVTVYLPSFICRPHNAAPIHLEKYA